MNRRLFFSLLPGIGAISCVRAPAVADAPSRLAYLPATDTVRPFKDQMLYLVRGRATAMAAMLAVVGQDPWVFGPVSASERDAAIAFFNGDQWDPRVLASRRAHARPCLVFNHLPVIVDRIAKRRFPCRHVDAEEFEALAIEVVRRARDPQMLVNFYESAIVELVAGSRT
jgi:hypothetical protein